MDAFANTKRDKKAKLSGNNQCINPFVLTLREKCPNTEFFLVLIFPHSDWIRRDILYLYVFGPNEGKYGPEKIPYLDTFHAVILDFYTLWKYYGFLYSVGIKVWEESG